MIPSKLMQALNAIPIRLIKIPHQKVIDHMTRCQIRVHFGGNEIHKNRPFFSAFFWANEVLGTSIYIRMVGFC